MTSLHGNLVTKILFVELAQLAKEDCKVAEYRLTLARDSAITKYPTWKDQIITLVNLLVNYNVLAKSFGGKTTVADADLNRVTEILTPSTVAHAQLGGIRASTAAMNGFAKADPNLSQDDQTILRFSIAVKLSLRIGKRCAGHHRRSQVERARRPLLQRGSETHVPTAPRGSQRPRVQSRDTAQDYRHGANPGEEVGSANGESGFCVRVFCNGSEGIKAVLFHS